MKQEQFEREVFKADDVVSVRAVELQALIREKEKAKMDKLSREMEIDILRNSVQSIKSKLDCLKLEQPFHVDLKV